MSRRVDATGNEEWGDGGEDEDEEDPQKSRAPSETPPDPTASPKAQPTRESTQTFMNLFVRLSAEDDGAFLPDLVVEMPGIRMRSRR